MPPKPHDGPEAGNVFDRTFKKILEGIIPDVLNKLLHVQFRELRPLREKMQINTEREVDFLALALLEDGTEFILHIEYQVHQDREMVYRMQEYHGILVRKHRKPVMHLVMYFGKQVAAIKHELPAPLVFDAFELISFNRLDHQLFMQANRGEEVLLAMLADWGNEAPETYIKLIADRLDALSATKNERRNWLDILTILSKLRNLEQQTKKIVTDMPILIDLKGTLGYDEGVKEGNREGLEAGILLSKIQTQIRFLINMLEADLPAGTIQVVSDLPSDFVESFIRDYEPAKARQLLTDIDLSSLKKGMAGLEQLLINYGISGAISHDFCRELSR